MKREYILYWTGRDGKVEFARDVDKNVQLFDETRAKAEVERRTCFAARVGFIGASEEGVPLQMG